MTKSVYPRLLLIRTGEEFEQTRTKTNSSYKRSGFKYVRVDDHIEYYSIKQGVGTSAPVKGYRSILRLEADESNAVEYDAIERANGFTHLAEGTYAKAYMQPRAHHSNNQEIYVTGNIFIHAAEYPEFLDGCIAPGKSTDEGGVQQSKEALKEIIDGLGGWKAGRFVRLEVRGAKNRPGR
ncbi:DUF5675 family protein [Bradyrhizobium oligotrophicum]|uniref:DUF5675 family protein n=1 Tax=Bradyrhizobium oligotrophicum TaxID=44255 RepID=UPI003EC0715F